MQEILFSAKRIDNGYTVCGYHVKDGVTGKHFIVAEGSMLHESDKVGEEGLLNFVAFEVDEDTISVTGDGWISVEERLPDKEGAYLVTYQRDKKCEEFDLPKIDVNIDYFRGGIWFNNCFSRDRNIAWRPLPEPYRTERSENDSKGF